MIIQGSQDDLYYLGELESLDQLSDLGVEVASLLSIVESRSPGRLSIEGFDFPVRALRDSPEINHYPSGLYGRRSLGKFQFVHLESGRAAVEQYSINSLYVASDPSIEIFQKFDSWWAQASSPSDKPPFVAGDWVLLKNENGFARVAHVSFNQGGYSVEVDYDNERLSVLPDELVRLEGDPRLLETWRRQKPATGQELLTAIAWAKLHYPLSNTLYSFAATRTIFRPYQFLPALKMIKSQRGRILIADEVGLGKTIEAGLIWTELEQREKLSRVLVIAPSSLTTKWRNEMRYRFMRELRHFRVADLEAYLEEVQRNPDAPLSAVMSIESLRTKTSVLEKLEASGAELDLVILDEAHQVRNRGTRGNVMAEFVADISKYLVLLSATPLNLGRDDLFNLMHLLDPNQFPSAEFFRLQVEPNQYLLEAKRQLFAGRLDQARGLLSEIPNLQFGSQVTLRPAFAELMSYADQATLSSADKAHVNLLTGELHTLSATLNRTRKVDTTDFNAVRETTTVEVEWTQAERDFYDEVHAYYLRKALMSGRPQAFILQMPLRQTCSSIPVMVRNLRDKKLIATELFEDEELEGMEEEDLEALEESKGDWAIEAPAPNFDSKLVAFVELLRELRDKGQKRVLVFTFFRGTVEYLVEELKGARFRVQGLHGGIAPADRHQLIEDFRSGEFEVMISNQVGSEGLDFEFCNVLVNYDLPWNPMQVEQRIGRLDRFGQINPKIFIYNMVVPGTIETDIFFRLYERIKIFTSTVGDLGQILQETMERISDLTIDASLSPQQLAAKIEAEAIAIENEAKTRASVEEERENLSILDQLDVEGLSESGPRKGRFVSTHELAGHLEHVVDIHGGTIKALTPERTVMELCGTPSLASALQVTRQLDFGTELGYDLVPVLRSGKPITLVLDSRVLSERHSLQEPVEIVSSRHPIVRLSQQLLGEPELLPNRFSDLVISSNSLTGAVLVLWSVFQTTGLDRKTELWATAIDLNTAQRREDIEDFLLAESGELVRSKTSTNSTVGDLEIQALRDVEDARFRLAIDIRQRENEAMIQSRLAAERAIEERKLESSTRRYQEAIESGGNQGYINMLRGKKVKSELRLAQLVQEFESKKKVVPAITRIALAKVTFSKTT
jgi:ERCC4-related helicase